MAMVRLTDIVLFNPTGSRKLLGGSSCAPNTLCSASWAGARAMAAVDVLTALPDAAKAKDVEMSEAPPTPGAKPSGADLYTKMKALQKQLEFLDIQEEYIKDEMQNLKRELVRAKEEVKRIQSVPLVIGQFLEIIDHNHGIVSSTTGSRSESAATRSRRALRSR